MRKTLLSLAVAAAGTLCGHQVAAQQFSDNVAHPTTNGSEAIFFNFSNKSGDIVGVRVGFGSQDQCMQTVLTKGFTNVIMGCISPESISVSTNKEMFDRSFVDGGEFKKATPSIGIAVVYEKDGPVAKIVEKEDDAQCDAWVEGLSRLALYWGCVNTTGPISVREQLLVDDKWRSNSFYWTTKPTVQQPTVPSGSPQATLQSQPQHRP